MLETDTYDPLANWFKNKYKLEWSKIAHENPCVIFNREDEIAEVDICLGHHKKNQLELTDVIHVKTKDNLQSKKDRYQLLGKAKYTLSGAKNVWLAVEKTTYNFVHEGVDSAIGIITYDEKGNNATNFTVRHEPKRTDSPKYDKQTQELVNKKFGQLVETAQNVFVCSMNQDNWGICKRHKLWGVPEKASAAESAIRRTKPGDIMLFRLNKGPDYVAMWMITSKPFEDKNGGPWKNENGSENRDFVWQVKMHPMLVEEFENPVKLTYTAGMNKETGISTKSYMSGMVEITDTQYKIIAKKLIDSNLNQLN